MWKNFLLKSTYPKFLHFLIRYLTVLIPAELCFDVGEESSLPLTLSVGSLSSQSKFKKVFFLRSTKVMSSTVMMKITYIITANDSNKSEANIVMENKAAEQGDLSDNKKMACFKEHPIKVTVVKPFDLSYKFVTMRFESLDKCFGGDPFIIMPQIKVLSPWPILIADTLLEMVNINFNYNSKDC